MVFFSCPFIKTLSHLWILHNFIFRGNQRKRVPGKMMQRNPNQSRRWTGAVGTLPPVGRKSQKTWRRRWAVKQGLDSCLTFLCFQGLGKPVLPERVLPTLSLFGLLECNPRENNVQATVWLWNTGCLIDRGNLDTHHRSSADECIWEGTWLARPLVPSACFLHIWTLALSALLWQNLGKGLILYGYCLVSIWGKAEFRRHVHFLWDLLRCVR